MSIFEPTSDKQRKENEQAVARNIFERLVAAVGRVKTLDEVEAKLREDRRKAEAHRAEIEAQMITFLTQHLTERSIIFRVHGSYYLVELNPPTQLHIRPLGTAVTVIQ